MSNMVGNFGDGRSTMGFKEARARARENVEFQATLEGYFIQNGELRLPPNGFSKIERVPIGGASAELEDGDGVQRTTLTRVAAGAIIAGPVGAIVGGMFKKDNRRVYVVVTLADGRVVVADAPKKDWPKARNFVAKVNQAGAWYASHEFGEFTGS